MAYLHLREHIVMRKYSAFTVVFAIFALAFGAGPAQAGKSDGKKDEYKVAYERDGCKYEYKETRKGYEEKMKCKGVWRDVPKQKYEYKANGCKYKYESSRNGYSEKYKCKGDWAGYGAPRHATAGIVFEAPSNAALGINQGRCNHELLGQILGGIAGAATGSQIGDGKGRAAAVVGGTIIGALIGGSVGRHFDETGQNCVAQTLEHAPDSQTVQWTDADSGQQYRVTPTASSTAPDGRYCREYVTTVIIGGKPQEAYGKACRQPDGSWQSNR